MKRLLSILSLLIILLSSCKAESDNDASLQTVSDESYLVSEYSFDEDWITNPFTISEDLQTPPPISEAAIIPYDGDDYIELNGNKPYFSTDSLLPNEFMALSPLDVLGRAGMAVCCVCKDTLNEGERQNGNLPNPTGWHSVQYDIISSKYLYHRCHLLSYHLTAENSKLENLITGTCYFNTNSMLKFENRIAECIKTKGLHVLYRVTPVYDGNELVARGVILEAFSVEDSGKEICFCVYVYNVQPGIEIDYLTGESRLIQ